MRLAVFAVPGKCARQESDDFRPQRNIRMGILYTLITLAYQIAVSIILLQVAVSWLINFEVINAANERAQNLIQLLKKVTDPVYKPIQKYVPPIGGIDVTPLIVIILLSVIKTVLLDIVY
jgi:YggT family protein